MAYNQDSTAKALQLVLEHSTGVNDVRTLCRLLQVSQAVQQAVQQAMCDGELTVYMASDLSSMARFASTAAWLPKHAALITKLTCSGSSGQVEILQTSCQLLSMALQLCAATAHSEGGPSAAAAAAAPGRGLWRLQAASFEHDWISTGVLKALGACSSLTDLTLALSPEQCRDAPLLRALSSLQTLRCLAINTSLGDRVIRELPAQFACSISSLLHLQKLHLDAIMPHEAVASLPSSLQKMAVTLSVTRGPRHQQQQQQQPASPTVDLAHLTLLRDLSLNTTGGAIQLHLPHGLTGMLTMSDSRVDLVSLPQRLHQLTILKLQVCMSLMQQLATMPSLMALWLVSAEVGNIERFFDAIVAAQQLTCLVVSFTDVQPMVARLHTRLRQLPRLQHLELHALGLEPADAQQFTALQQLTALHMRRCRGIGDLAAAAIACQLTNLRVLVFDCCGLESPLLWPALDSCTKLEQLAITAAAGGAGMCLTDSTLPLLTKLTRLTALVGPKLDGVSAEVFAEFRAALPLLKHLPALPRAAG